MYQDIMNQKIADAVKSYAQTNEKKIIDSALDPIIKKDDAGNGKNDEENIVAFENMGIFGLVMVGMKIPHQSVHHVFMGEPGDTFHQQKNA